MDLEKNLIVLENRFIPVVIKSPVFKTRLETNLKLNAKLKIIKKFLIELKFKVTTILIVFGNNKETLFKFHLFRIVSGNPCAAAHWCAARILWGAAKNF